jgi:cytochrome c oxidase cbb3-type subunit II
MNHESIEKNITLMGVLIIVAISFGGLAEIVPLFYLKNTTQPIEGLKPYTALELEGRDIYIKEGCHVCHTQMVRPFRAETERFGPYSVAGEDVYEYPFLWGSKRTGPDLARVGGRYSDDWHYFHLMNPRDLVPESNMPSYPWLAENILDHIDTPKKLKAMKILGVPYSDDDIAASGQAVKGKTEMEALIAYLQSLGLEVTNKLGVAQEISQKGAQ